MNTTTAEKIQNLEISRDRILNILTVENNLKARGEMQYRILKINSEILNLK